MNEIKLSGVVCSCKQDHIINKKVFYLCDIKIIKFNKIIDFIPVLSIKPLNINSYVYVIGEIRTYNQQIKNKKHLKVYVLANDIFIINNKSYLNFCKLEGYVCKEPICRITPKGKMITEIIIAVNRAYGKTSYIPCIAWDDLSNLKTGMLICISGRLQSRIYVKNKTKHVCYEVSISEYSLLT